MGAGKEAQVELLAAYGSKYVVEGIQGHLRLGPKSLLEDSGLAHWASQCPDSEPPLNKAEDLICHLAEYLPCLSQANRGHDSVKQEGTVLSVFPPR